MKRIMKTQRKIEHAVVQGYKKIEDGFVGTFMSDDSTENGGKEELK